MERGTIRRARSAAAVLGLVAFTALAGAASWHALGQAAYLLHRASFSQRQLELFGQVESRLHQATADHVRALVLGEPPQVAAWLRDLEALLATLETVTAAEVALLADDPEQQDDEQAELAAITAWRAHVHALAAIAAHPGDGADALARFESLGRQPHALALVGALRRAAADEHHEVAAVNQEMAALRRRLGWLGAAAVAAHALAAAMVAIAAIRRREGLEAEVARRTAALRQANADLQRIDDCRKRFFTDVSHELRTPLTTIQGEAEVMLSLGGPEESGYRTALAAIQAYAGCLRRRIDDLLAVARAGDGQVRLDRAPLDLAALVTAAHHEVSGLARASDVAVDVRMPPAPVWVDGDASWLKQAVLTVADNAIKFSAPGQAILLALNPSGGTAVLAVTDHGEGIAEADLPRLFDRFFQAPAGRQRGGSGLGLAVARWIVEEHGGHIAIASRPGAGTTVTLTLPLAPPAGTAPAST